MQPALQHEIRRWALIQGSWTLAFLAVLALAVLLVFKVPELAAWRSVIILLPLIPALGIFRFTLHQFRRGDEMLRRHQLVAAAWAFGILQVLMLAWALLETVGWQPLPMWVIFAVSQAVWVACIWTQLLRYR